MTFMWKEENKKPAARPPENSAPRGAALEDERHPTRQEATRLFNVSGPFEAGGHPRLSSIPGLLPKGTARQVLQMGQTLREDPPLPSRGLPRSGRQTAARPLLLPAQCPLPLPWESGDPSPLQNGYKREFTHLANSPLCR